MEAGKIHHSLPPFLGSTSSQHTGHTLGVTTAALNEELDGARRRRRRKEKNASIFLER